MEQLLALLHAHTCQGLLYEGCRQRLDDHAKGMAGAAPISAISAPQASGMGSKGVDALHWPKVQRV